MTARGAEESDRAAGKEFELLTSAGGLAWVLEWSFSTRAHLMSFKVLTRAGGGFDLTEFWVVNLPLTASMSA